MQTPPLLTARPLSLRVLIVIGGPLIAGVIAGWLLGQSEAGYLLWTLVMILGGLAAGLEHETRRGGALRGLVGGVLFAGTILLTHELIGDEALANLPDPPILLCVFFGVVSLGLGIAGAALRTRMSDHAAAA